MGSSSLMSNKKLSSASPPFTTNYASRGKYRLYNQNQKVLLSLNAEQIHEQIHENNNNNNNTNTTTTSSNDSAAAPTTATTNCVGVPVNRFGFPKDTTFP